MLSSIPRRSHLVALGLLLAACSGPPESRELIVATTTSVRDSGLLDAVMPAFVEQTGIEPKLIAIGTGAALRMGREGNADALLTHAPEAEAALVAEGRLVSRTPFMRNYFVLAGPRLDPARVRDLPVLQALVRLRVVNAAFVSRADDSGTHKREVALMRAAGIDPDPPWPAVVQTGSGMGQSLQVAGEKQSYILSDLGTFLAFQERTDLVALSQPEPQLENTYSVMRVAGSPRGEGAAAFVAFWTSSSTQAQIARFGVERFGRALFEPLLAGAGDG
jgi:tungstate transport system substrate-binding protein